MQLSKPDAKDGVPTQTARFAGTAFLPSASLDQVQLRNTCSFLKYNKRSPTAKSDNGEAD